MAALLPPQLNKSLPLSGQGALRIPRSVRGGGDLIPSFSAVPLAAGCFRTGLLEGVPLSRPRVGREATLGQKSSALLSVCVLLSLLPVFAWALLAEVARAAGDSAVAGGVGSKGVDVCSWGSFPSSNPVGRRTAFSMPFFKNKTKKPSLGRGRSCQVNWF